MHFRHHVGEGFYGSWSIPPQLCPPTLLTYRLSMLTPCSQLWPPYQSEIFNHQIVALFFEVSEHGNQSYIQLALRENAQAWTGLKQEVAMSSAGSVGSSVTLTAVKSITAEDIKKPSLGTSEAPMAISLPYPMTMAILSN